MDDLIQNYSRTEYMMTFQSIMLGFIVSKYFIAWGKLVRLRDKIKITPLFLIISLVTFLIVVIHWWNMYERAELIVSDLLKFTLSLPYVLIYYFIAIFIFTKVEITQFKSTDEVYFLNKKPIFITILLWFLFDLLASITTQDLPFSIVGILLCIVILSTKNRSINWVVLVTGLLTIIIYLINDALLGSNKMVSNYSQAEHLTIMLAIVYGFTITIFFEGWSDFAYSFRNNKISITQFAWSLFTFLLLIQLWYIGWQNNQFIYENILQFLFVLLSTLIIYLISVLLFPEKQLQGLDYTKYFFRNKTLIFSLFGILFFLNFLYSVTAGKSFIENENLYRFLGISLCGVAIAVDNIRFHQTLSVLSIILLAYVMFLA